MKFLPAPLAGALLIEPEPMSDDRGFFARLYDSAEFAARGLETSWPHVSISFNRRAGTLRGLHWQQAPFEETKLVRCTRGAIHDVILDLRRDSPTFGRWHAEELSADNHRMLYVPRGLAHGFQSLGDNCEVAYHLSAPYRPDAARGVRWNDPRFGIRWPLEVTAISDADRSMPDFRDLPP